MTPGDIVTTLQCGKTTCQCHASAKRGMGLTHCPAHADGTPSLSVTPKGPAGVLVHCHNNCSQEQVVEALRAKGLWGGGAEKHSAHSAPSAPSKDDRPWPDEPVAVYDYLLAIKGRFEREGPEGTEKTFLWRLPDSPRWDGFHGQVSMTDMELWGAAEIRAAPERPVWFCEGEKATQALRSRNELATCGPWGASQKDFGQALEVLRGRDVYLWPDNDPAGQEYMAAIHHALKGVARRVRVLPAQGPVKGDAFDFFVNGGTIEGLLAGLLTEPVVEVIADDHLRVRVPTEVGEIRFDCENIDRKGDELHVRLSVSYPGDLGQSEGPYRIRTNLLSASARTTLVSHLKQHFTLVKPNWMQEVVRVTNLLEEALGTVDIDTYEPPDPDATLAPYLVEGLIQRGAGTILHGLPKKGKSQLALALAVAIDSGSSRIFKVRQAHVLYVNLERSRESMDARLVRINVSLGLERARPLRFIHARGKSFATIHERVKRVVRERGVELVILDSISRGGFGDLNTNQVGNAAVDALNQLGVAWLAIGHEPRQKNGETNAGHLYGSIHQEAGADIIAGLRSKPGADNSLRVEVRVTDANDMRPPPNLYLTYEFNEDGLDRIRRKYTWEEEPFAEEKPMTVREELLQLLDDGGWWRTKDIAEALGKPAGNISRELKGMLTQGLIVQGRDRRYCLSGPETPEQGNLDDIAEAE